MTVKDYIELIDKREIDTLLRFSERAKKPFDYLSLGNFEEWDFDLVKEAQQMINEFTFYHFVIYVTDKFKKDIGNFDLIKACQNYYYFLEQIEKSIELENELLQTEIDADSELAGIKGLAELGAYLQIRTIAQALNLKIEEVKKMKYKDAFLELLTQKRLNDYNRKLMDIKTKKYKHG